MTHPSVPERPQRELAPGQVTRRRRAAAFRQIWRLFRRNRAGMVGLVLLLGVHARRRARSACWRIPPGSRSPRRPGGVLEAPSAHYPLGTDDNGRSILTLLIWGSRVSLFVGLFATAISMILGTLVGLTSGFFEGWPAAILFRLTEWFLVIPYLPLAMVLVSVLGRSLRQHRDRHRPHELGEHRPAHPQPDVVDQGAVVPGESPGARRRSTTTDDPARAAERHARW